MEQKRVSFKVAKAIKEAGYPQKCDKFYAGTQRYHDTTERTIFEGYLIDRYEDRHLSDCAAPYALDVWLWLWREKGIGFTISATNDNCGFSHHRINGCYTEIGFSDPEEAIIAAIDAALDYLIKNKE